MNKFNIPSYHQLFPNAIEKPMNVEEALKVIQKHERARQGVLRASAMDQIRKEEQNRNKSADIKVSPKQAVDKISMWYTWPSKTGEKNFI